MVLRFSLRSWVNCHTDGNLSKDKRHISLTSSDKKLIRTFLKCLHKTNKIGLNPKSDLLKKKCYRTQIGQSKMATLKFSTKEAKILLNWLYYKPNLPRLDRKYKIGKKFVTLKA